MIFGRHRKTVFIILLLILAVSGFSAMTVGSASIPFSDILRIVFPGIFSGAGSLPASFTTIIMKIRLPRVILAVITGMGLAVSGTVFQGIFRNPMANPYVLGISSGAAFAVSLSLILGMQLTFMGMTAVSVSAFAGGIGTAFIVYFLSGNGRSTFSLLLSGIAMNFFLSALTSLVMYLNRDQIENIVYWTMGSFNAASWEKIIISGPVVIAGSLILIIFSKDLNIMTMGDDTAKSLGVNVRSKRLLFLIISTVITAGAVSVSGVIGFVGLIIPHIMRILTGPDHRTLLPVSMVAGGIFLLISDTLARTVLSPTEIPVGIITSLFGAPFFIFLLARGRNSIP